MHQNHQSDTPVTDSTQVDIIVCGGGSAGCVVAGRLANLDHNLQVLLIEGGESNLNNPWWASLLHTKQRNITNPERVYRPGIYPRNMKLDSKTASFYYSRPSEWLDGRRAVVPCAHILGGGSSINFMVSFEISTCLPNSTKVPQMYTRASASDYDDFQAKGWTTKELIPLMKKHETYQVSLGYLQATINAYRL
jgi:alcohol oxidase